MKPQPRLGTTPYKAKCIPTAPTPRPKPNYLKAITTLALLTWGLILLLKVMI